VSQYRGAGALTFVAVLLLCIPDANAHDGRPLFVLIEEFPNDNIQISWQAPSSIDTSQAPTVNLAVPCIVPVQSSAIRNRQSSAIYHCLNGISGSRILIEYPTYNPSISTLVRVEFDSGETRSALLDPAQSEWHIPAPETSTSIVRNYFALGVRHILGGIDHLLFIAGLLYIARSGRRIFVTLTGFTLAHSLTMCLIALDLIHPSFAATEVIIALSIVFLAGEIARDRRDTLSWRRPAVIASIFGLVHGAGFAAALTETGLPSTDTISALLFFNLGVEAGQLMIVAFAIAAIRLFFAIRPRVAVQTKRCRLQTACGYGIGVISAFWFVDRLALALP